MIRAYKGMQPRLAEGVFVDVSAQVIGDVELAEHASVWMNCVLRGDIHSIRVGARTNIQDGSVVHVEGGEFPTRVGERVTVGHGVILHGCEVEEDCLIGMGATLLNGCRIGAGSIVAAGCLVPEGMQVPPGSLVMGVPGRVKRSTTPEERERIRLSAEHYVEQADAYLAEAAGGEG